MSATTSQAGHAVHYDHRGAGADTIVFVHGWGSNRSFFDHLTDRLGNRTVLSIDLRGHGESDAPTGADSYSISYFADDVRAAMADAGISDAVVVGHSMGAVVALELARLGLARGLVLLDPAVMADTAMLHQLKTQLVPAVVQDVGGEVRVQVVTGLMGSGDFERRDEVLQEMKKAPPEVSAAALSAVVGYDSRQAFADVSVPLLVVQASVPNDSAETLRALNPTAEFESVNTGHFVQLEAPDEVAALVDHFVEKVNGR